MIEILNRKDCVEKAEPLECHSCSGCGSRFTYELEDARIAYSLGWPDTANIDCPVCGCEARVGLTSRQQAIAWRDRAKLRRG